MKDASSTPEWPSLLREKGLRATTQRVCVLDFLHKNPHGSVDMIFQAVRSCLPTISPQAVHMIVHDLSANNIIRRINLPDSTSAQYETRIEDNHHHIQCIKCGRIEDVDCAVGHAPCLHPCDAHGMRIIEASVVFRGVCHNCEPLPPTHKGK